MMPSVVAIDSPAAAAMLASEYGTAQPPCWKPPRTSSSGRAGACITPSRVTLLVTTTLLIGSSLTLPPAPRRLLTLYTSGLPVDRHEQFPASCDLRSQGTPGERFGVREAGFARRVAHRRAACSRSALMKYPRGSGKVLLDHVLPALVGVSRA